MPHGYENECHLHRLAVVLPFSDHDESSYPADPVFAIPDWSNDGDILGGTWLCPECVKDSARGEKSFRIGLNLIAFV